MASRRTRRAKRDPAEVGRRRETDLALDRTEQDRLFDAQQGRCAVCRVGLDSPGAARLACTPEAEPLGFVCGRCLMMIGLVRGHVDEIVQFFAHPPARETEMRVGRAVNIDAAIERGRARKAAAGGKRLMGFADPDHMAKHHVAVVRQRQRDAS